MARWPNWRGRLRWSMLLLVAVANMASNAQSLHVDWSRVVSVDSGGEATFGPRVDVPDGEDDGLPSVPPIEDHLDESGSLGYFANSDGFYGRDDHTEYMIVQKGEGGRLQALKIVGDANVPRGHLTWRSPPGYFDNPTWRTPIQLQLRDNPQAGDDGFWWSPGHRHELVWQSASLTAFDLVGQNPTGFDRSRFFQVSEEEALRAAQTTPDAP